MLFTSCVFLFIFFPAVLGIYYLLRNTPARNFFLLLASLFFYSWGEISYCWVMLAVIAVNFVSAIAIESTEAPRLRKALVSLAIVADLCILAWFKYAGFLAVNANCLLKGFSVPQIQLGDIHLPLGISFFVFHSLSYVVDVYRKTASAQRNPFTMGLYISLFPQLVAGPIVRYHEIKDQLTERTHSVDKFADGVSRFCIGFAKKMLIANTVAQPVDKIFALPANELTMGLAWLAAICYTFQIYFDFSGYSDMAIGIGLMFGFKLPENFNYPYISQSMREFWQRWHMSLSNWFRDYLYIPLGGNRVPAWRVCMNLVIVFFLCGLWHGASWQFVAWGIYHGSFLGVERAFGGKLLQKLWTPLRHAYATLVFVIGWVLFRAESFPQAVNFYKAMAGFGATKSMYPVELYFTSELAFVLCVALVASLPLAPYVVAALEKRKVAGIAQPAVLFRPAWCLSICMLSIIEVANGTYNPFIYFRF